MSSTEAFSCTAVGSCVFFFFLGGHPWYALSNPFSSAATPTRKPFRGFRQSPLKAQPIKRKNGSTVRNDQQNIESTRSSCIPSSSSPPPRERPLATSMPGKLPSAKRPTARMPHTADAPCTPIAPTGSSIFRCRIQSFVSKARIPPTAPIKGASGGCTQAQVAVIATRDPKMPLAISSATMSLPLDLALVYSSAVVPPPAVAFIVVTPARVATIHLVWVIPKELPQLKPIQPHHSMKRPIKRLLEDEGLKSSGGRVPSKRPWRGPKTRIPINPFTAPTRCTGPLPAKSCTPNCASQPLADHTQCATNEYTSTA
mmetsp:Transcript_55950/g.131184  ORF Transcript_55950/g.131184 Transcript_55950/m.131184 type:complete len:313 (+) Transcript_55950:155-1093(+)